MSSIDGINSPKSRGIEVNKIKRQQKDARGMRNEVVY